MQEWLKEKDTPLISSSYKAPLCACMYLVIFLHAQVGILMIHEKNKTHRERERERERETDREIIPTMGLRL